MVAYLEKNDGNTEFHQIMDFLTHSSIHFALTVSPIVSTSFVEQFWTSAKSRTVNNISYIDVIVSSKPVTISEASIRSDLLFDDDDGIDTLNNQAIFDTIQLMGYEGDLNTLTFNKALFSPQWKFLFHTMNHCISSKSTSWDQIPTNIATAVIYFYKSPSINKINSTMAGLDFCSKNNMVAYLEKNDGNIEFHQIMDFLTHSSIHFALTVSPIVSTSFVEQFWTSAKSRTVNNISYIDVIVSNKPVTISEASIRSDLLFDDDDGIDTLNNQAIFNTIQLMGHLDASKKFVIYPRFLQIFLRNRLRDVHVPMDHFPVPALTKKVLTFMVKKGKNFSGNVTPLFHSMLVQPTEDEGEVSERPSKSQPIPSPTHPSKDQPESQPDLYPRPSFSIPIPDSNPEGSGGNHGEASLNEAMDTLAQDEGKTDSKVEEPKTSSKTEELHLSDDTLVVEDKGSVEKGGSTKGFDLQQSTVKPDEGTDKQDESTDSFVEVFGDDETIAQVLVTMSQNKVKQKEKEKGVELKNVEDIERPRPTSTRSVLTLKPDSLKSHTY
ncbi:hypothetical protein Tco_0786065 [Tanacetum coccineum]